MSREIKCRAIKPDDGHFLFWSIWDKDVDQIEVDKNTAGLYTGRADKNGRDIYEGDILDGHSDGLVIVVWSESNCGWDCLFNDEGNIGLNEMCVWFGNNSIIIGNIHQNPYLIPKFV